MKFQPNDVVLVAFPTGLFPALCRGYQDGLVAVEHVDPTTGSGEASALVREADCFLLTNAEQLGPSPINLGVFCDFQIPASTAYQWALARRASALAKPVTSLIDEIAT